MNVLLYSSPIEVCVACSLPAAGPVGSQTLCKKSFSHGKWQSERKPWKTIESPSVSVGPNMYYWRREAIISPVYLAQMLGTAAHVSECSALVRCCVTLLLANLLLPNTYIIPIYTCLWLPKIWEVCSKSLLSSWSTTSQRLEMAIVKLIWRVSANQLPSLQLPKSSRCTGACYDFFEVSVFLMKEKELVVSGICSLVMGRL